MAESIVLTVPMTDVNETIRLRQTFGWQLVQSNARSFLTDASAYGTGYGIGTISVQSSRLSYSSTHLTDLLFQRLASPTNEALARLENEYDAIRFHAMSLEFPIILVAAVGGFIVASLLFGTIQYVIDHSGDTVPRWVYAAGALVGIPTGIGLTIREAVRDAHSNQQGRQRRRSILHEARRLNS